MKQGPSITPEAAEGLAIQALSFIAQDAEQLERFLAITGIDAGEIRAAAGQPGFLAGVLEHVAADQRLLASFTAAADIAPGDVDSALRALGDIPWERDSS